MAQHFIYDEWKVVDSINELIVDIMVGKETRGEVGMEMERDVII